MSLRISPGVVDFIHGLTSTRFIFAINQNQLNYLRKTRASLLALAETIYYQEWLDDTTVFLRNQESMNVLLELQEKFERCSGLKINPTKSYGSENGKIEKIPFSTLSGQRNLSLYLGYTFRTAKEHVIN